MQLSSLVWNHQANAIIRKSIQQKKIHEILQKEQAPYILTKQLKRRKNLDWIEYRRKLLGGGEILHKFSPNQNFIKNVYDWCAPIFFRLKQPWEIQLCEKNIFSWKMSVEWRFF